MLLNRRPPEDSTALSDMNVSTYREHRCSQNMIYLHKKEIDIKRAANFLKVITKTLDL